MRFCSIQNYLEKSGRQDVLNLLKDHCTVRKLSRHAVTFFVPDKALTKKLQQMSDSDDHRDDAAFIVMALIIWEHFPTPSSFNVKGPIANVSRKQVKVDAASIKAGTFSIASDEKTNCVLKVTPAKDFTPDKGRNLAVYQMSGAFPSIKTPDADMDKVRERTAALKNGPKRGGGDSGDAAMQAIFRQEGARTDGIPMLKCVVSFCMWLQLTGRAKLYDSACSYLDDMPAISFVLLAQPWRREKNLMAKAFREWYVATQGVCPCPAPAAKYRSMMAKSGAAKSSAVGDLPTKQKGLIESRGMRSVLPKAALKFLQSDAALNCFPEARKAAYVESDTLLASEAELRMFYRSASPESRLALVSEQCQLNEPYVAFTAKRITLSTEVFYSTTNIIARSDLFCYVAGAVSNDDDYKKFVPADHFGQESEALVNLSLDSHAEFDTAKDAVDSQAGTAWKARMDFIRLATGSSGAAPAVAPEAAVEAAVVPASE